MSLIPQHRSIFCYFNHFNNQQRVLVILESSIVDYYECSLVTVFTQQLFTNKFVHLAHHLFPWLYKESQVLHIMMFLWFYPPTSVQTWTDFRETLIIIPGEVTRHLQLLGPAIKNTNIESVRISEVVVALARFSIWSRNLISEWYFFRLYFCKRRRQIRKIKISFSAWWR
jgi:hypothetical protein